jgi:hypothetical protein
MAQATAPILDSTKAPLAIGQSMSALPGYFRLRLAQRWQVHHRARPVFDSDWRKPRSASISERRDRRIDGKVWFVTQRVLSRSLARHPRRYARE